jgi:DeoR/GlpR family transcriptional regulator of sugar metabolism
MKNSRAAIQVRQNEILKMLQKQGKMAVDVIAERIDVTPTTVRRDLAQMEKMGLVRRGFGSAEYMPPDYMREIEPTNIEDDKELTRRKIAKEAASMVEEGDVLFLNSSGTASLVLEYLKEKNVTVLTNNARIINRPHGDHVQIILVGGEVYGKKQSLIGQFALDTIARVVATKCILGISGISATGGLTSQILPETQINLLMLQQCNGPKIVVADSSKVGITQTFYSGNLKDVTHLITDSGADHRSLQDISKAGVNVVCV